MGGGSVRSFFEDIGMGSVAKELDRASGKSDKDKAVKAEQEAARIQREADKKREIEKKNEEAREGAEASRDRAAKRQRARSRKNKGRDSTLLGGMSGDSEGPMSGGKSLLGM